MKVYECPNCLQDNERLPISESIYCQVCHCVYMPDGKIVYACGLCQDTHVLPWDKSEDCPNCIINALGCELGSEVTK